MSQPFKSSSILPPDQVAAQLRALADGLEAGSARIHQGGQTVQLDPFGLLHMELDCESGEHGQCLRLRLKWPRSSPLQIISQVACNETPPTNAADSARSLAAAIDQAMDSGDADVEAMTEPYEDDIELARRQMPGRKQVNGPP